MIGHWLSDRTRGEIAWASGSTAPLTVTWLWKPGTPFDVRVGLLTDNAERPVWWRIPRDFLIRAYTTGGRIESRDVAAECVGDVLTLQLNGEDDVTATITIPAEPLRAVLVASYERVPAGSEPVVVDDAEIAQILGSSHG